MVKLRDGGVSFYAENSWHFRKLTPAQAMNFLEWAKYVPITSEKDGYSSKRIKPMPASHYK